LCGWRSGAGSKRQQLADKIFPSTVLPFEMYDIIHRATHLFDAHGFPSNGLFFAHEFLSNGLFFAHEFLSNGLFFAHEFLSNELFFSHKFLNYGRFFA